MPALFRATSGSLCMSRDIWSGDKAISDAFFLFTPLPAPPPGYVHRSSLKVVHSVNDQILSPFPLRFFTWLVFASLTLFSSSFLKIILFILFLALLGLHCWTGFSLTGVSRDSSLVVMCRPLMVVASRCRACALGCSGFSTCNTWAH